MYPEDDCLESRTWKKAIDEKLYQASQNFDIEALILADERGLALGTSSDEAGETEELLAALAPLMSAGDANQRARLGAIIRNQAPLTRGLRITVRPFLSHGDVFFLCAILDPKNEDPLALDATLAQLSHLIDN